MTTQSDLIQEKRDGLDLLQAFTDPTTRNLIIRAFESELTAYMVSLLNPELPDAEALWIRAQAVGVVKALNKMGVNMQTVANLPLKRAASKVVRQQFGEDLAG